MKVPVLYIVGTNDPIATFCRIHRKKPISTGDDVYSFGAERIDIEPRLVWFIAEAPTLVRNAIVSVEVGEAYQIATIEPPDGVTVTAVCKRLRAADTVGLPVP